MTDISAFRERVEAFIEQHAMTPTAFGRMFAGDPLFIFQLRDGREPRTATREKILKAMREHVGGIAA